jgi:hypothetical protein
MDFFDQVKKFFASLGSSAKKFFSSLMKSSPEVKKPGPKRKDGYSVSRPDAEEELLDFQRNKPPRPAAKDNELSDVLDNVLDQMPKGSDSGLYAKKHPK